jgi:hypothetical protein
MLTEEIPKIRPSTSELIVEPSDLPKVNILNRVGYCDRLNIEASGHYLD